MGILFASSSLLVSCSDDDYPNMGAIVVNSLQTTSNSVTAYWTIVSNGSCDGYKVVINEGTRENKGAEVVNQTFKPKEYNYTFTGLNPNTSYVITTQAIPSASSGWSTADTYEMQFMTAPLVSGISFGSVTYYDVEEADKDGNFITYKRGSVTASWNALAANNCGGYTANFDVWQLADTSKPEADNNKYDWRNVKSETVTSASANSVTFDKLIEEGLTYRVRVRPNPSNACWYPSGEFTISDDLVAPAAE